MYFNTLNPRLLLTVASSVALSFASQASVKIATDVTNSANKKPAVYSYWDVRNEIPAYPSPGPQQAARPDKENLIRLLGGWVGSDGKEDFSADAARWDSVSKKIVYKLEKVTDRIDGVMDMGYEIHQVVLDNPPWVFRRGLTFSANPKAGEYDEKNRITTYGNSLPPGDRAEWKKFISAVVKKMVDTYGKSTVEKWSFRVHTEADLFPGHWAGTKQDYFNHYRDTVEAVKASLPTAKFAAHFIQPSETHSGERYGVEFINWTKTNNLPLNFVGQSYYPFYNKSEDVDMNHLYTANVQPFQKAPGYQSGTKLGFHEFALFTERDDDGFSITAQSSHKDAFYAMLAKFALEKGLNKIHSWGDVTKNPLHQAVGTMIGKDRYKNSRTGTPKQSGNVIDGFFASNPGKTQIDVLVSNYNANPAYVADDEIVIEVTVPFAPGTSFRYRTFDRRRSNNPQYQFAQKHPQTAKLEKNGGWILNNINKRNPNQVTDPNGSFDDILNATGKSVWNQEKGALRAAYETMNFSSYTNVKTTAIGTSSTKSKVRIVLPIPSFSFRKVEIRKI